MGFIFKGELQFLGLRRGEGEEDKDSRLSGKGSQASVCTTTSKPPTRFHWKSLAFPLMSPSGGTREAENTVSLEHVWSGLQANGRDCRGGKRKNHHKFIPLPTDSWPLLMHTGLIGSD